MASVILCPYRTCAALGKKMDGARGAEPGNGAGLFGKATWKQPGRNAWLWGLVGPPAGLGPSRGAARRGWHPEMEMRACADASPSLAAATPTQTQGACLRERGK